MRSLWDLLQRHRNVRLEVGADLASLRLAASGAVLETDRGDIRARLVVAADGARSRVRELLAVPAEEAPTGHHALATVVRTEQEHEGTCLQRFLLEGPLALLPTADAHLSSVVWSQPAEEAERRAKEPDGDFCLAEDLSDYSWKSDDYERIPFDSDRWHQYFSDIAFA